MTVTTSFDPRAYWEERLGRRPGREGVGHAGLGEGLNGWMYRVRRRVFLRELSADPLGWLAGQLADLSAVLDRAGVGQDVAAPSDAASLKEMAPAIVAATSMMLDKVRAGELGTAPAAGADDSDGIRNGWL